MASQTMDERRFIVSVFERRQVVAAVVMRGADLIEVRRHPSRSHPPTSSVVTALAHDYGTRLVIGELPLIKALNSSGLRPKERSLTDAKRMFLGRERATHLELCRFVLAHDPRLQRFVGPVDVLLEDDAWRIVPLLAVALGLSAQLTASRNQQPL